jgi:hypothetical protein
VEPHGRSLDIGLGLLMLVPASRDASTSDIRHPGSVHRRFR